MKRRYAVLDVFTDRPLAGNALAVVLDAEGLGDHQMQAIAGEFNLSETVFVFPPDNALHSARLRIFTPGRELPFAGHPTVGTAVLLGQAKMAAAGPGRHEVVLVLEEKIGPVRCGGFVTGGPSGHAIFDLPAKPQAVQAALDHDALAMGLGLGPNEIGFEGHQPVVFALGWPVIFVPVRDLDTIARAALRQESWQAAFGSISDAVYLYCRQTVAVGNQFHARCFLPGAAIAEDPATGAAAAAFAGVVARFDQLTAGTHHILIEQGIEMGRPSLIKLEIDMEQGAVAAARIGGDAVVVAEGMLAVD